MLRVAGSSAGVVKVEMLDMADNFETRKNLLFPAPAGPKLENMKPKPVPGFINPSSSPARSIKKSTLFRVFWLFPWPLKQLSTSLLIQNAKQLSLITNSWQVTFNPCNFARFGFVHPIVTHLDIGVLYSNFITDEAFNKPKGTVNEIKSNGQTKS